MQAKTRHENLLDVAQHGLTSLRVTLCREVLRAAIAFHRRRRALHRELAAIPEGDSEQPPQQPHPQPMLS